MAGQVAGVHSIAGAKINTADSTWEGSSAPTGMALGANDGLVHTPDVSLVASVEWAETEAFDGVSPIMREGYVGRRGGRGVVKCIAGYKDYAAHRMLGAFCSNESVATATDGEDHTHLIDPESTEFVQFANYNGVFVEDAALCKVVRVKFTAEEGKLAFWEFELIAKDFITDDSGNNTIAGMASCAPPTSQPAIRYLQIQDGQSLFRANANSGGGLGGGDEYGVSKFTWEAIRSDSAHYTSLSAPLTDNPQPGGGVRVVVGWTLNKMTATTEWDWVKLGTKLKADMTFTGTSLGTDDYKVFFEAPLLQITSPTPTQTAGTTPLEITTEARVPASAPTGMSRTVPAIVWTDTVSGTHVSNSTS